MSLLTIVLFLLGLSLLIVGLRRQSPQDNDLLTALKGLVHLKNELTKVKDDIQALEDKVASQNAAFKLREVQSDHYGEFVKPDYKVSASWAAETGGERFPAPNCSTETAAGLSSGLSGSRKEKLNFEVREEKPDTTNIASPNAKAAGSLPEKYLKALELANAGMSVRDIANRLALSQDAVNLVLQTYPKGGKV